MTLDEAIAIARDVVAGESVDGADLILAIAVMRDRARFLFLPRDVAALSAPLWKRSAIAPSARAIAGVAAMLKIVEGMS